GEVPPALGARGPRRSAIGEEVLALGLVEPTPDAVGLADPDGVVEAVLLHRAGGADLLRPGLALELLLLALEHRRREEDGGVWSPARGPQLPILDVESTQFIPPCWSAIGRYRRPFPV